MDGKVEHLIPVLLDETVGEIPQLCPLVFVPAQEEEAAKPGVQFNSYFQNFGCKSVTRFGTKKCLINCIPDLGAELEGKHGLDVVFGLRARPHDGQGQVADVGVDLQGGCGGHGAGWVDLDLWSSFGWWALTVATVKNKPTTSSTIQYITLYCLARLSCFGDSLHILLDM